MGQLRYAAERPRLSVFEPTEDLSFSGGSELPCPGWTLSEFFARWYCTVPARERNLKPKTLVAYKQSVSLWDQTTGRPPMDAACERTSPATADFLAALREMDGRRGQMMSADTQRKHITHVEAVFRAAGPEGCEILDRVPRFRKPERAERAPNGDYTLAEIERLLAACSEMHTPCEGPPPQVFWRALVIFAVKTALRRETIYGVQWAMLQDGVLRIPGGLGITKRNKPHALPLMPDVLAAIEPLRGYGERIFPWPASPEWLGKQMRRLTERAGIERNEWSRAGFHGFRKTLATQLDSLDDGAATIALHHSSSSTTRDYYVNAQRAEERKLARMAEAFGRLPPLGATTNG